MEEEIIKKIPVDKVYDDALSSAMKQIGLVLGKTVKASRFILAPIDYIATYHDRWERYLEKIAERVDEKNLTQGHPQIVIPVLEGLILSYENTLLSEFFINLLANSVDKTKQNLAHPAFPKIIQQLSHDEAVILYFLKKRKFKVTQQFDFDHSKHLISNLRIISNEFPLNKLQFPENLFLYLDHLHSLNIAGMWKAKDEAIIDKKINDQVGGYIYNEISLTKFGELFVDSCVPDKFDFNIL